MQIAAVSLFAEIWLTHAASSLPRGSEVLSHILNWLLYETVSLEVMKACNFIDFSGGECWRMPSREGWRAWRVTGTSLLWDKLGWQAVSVVFNVKKAVDLFSENTHAYLCLSIQYLVVQVLERRTVLFPSWKLWSRTSAMYEAFSGLFYIISFGKQIASATAVAGLDDPAMLNSLRAAINRRNA